MGKWVFDKGYSNGMTQEAKDTIEHLGILFKGPMETPKGKGVKSINVTARKTWNTYANKRTFQTLHGVNTVFSKAGVPIDLTIVRENIEDTYGGVEHKLSNDVAISRRFITRPGSEQVIRYTFEIAKAKKAKRVTCGHKANIMKLTDGLFLETFYKVAEEYPDIHADDVIVDDLCMKMVMNPQQFDIIVLTNLQGDIVSDLCAGLVGGLGFAPSANIGDHICIFEAVHGTAPDIAGKNIANPTALLLSGIGMLHHLGLSGTANKIENALLYTLEQGVHTGDFGDQSSPALNTTDFAQAIIDNFGKKPVLNAREDASDTLRKHKVSQMANNMMMCTRPTPKERICGVDFFINTSLLPEPISLKCADAAGDKFKLVSISNRGTQVWPGGSKYTNLVDIYTVRFESIDQTTIQQEDIIELYKNVTRHFEVSTSELLLEIDGQRAYSLAQGQ